MHVLTWLQHTSHAYTYTSLHIRTYTHTCSFQELVSLFASAIVVLILSVPEPKHSVLQATFAELLTRGVWEDWVYTHHPLAPLQSRPHVQPHYQVSRSQIFDLYIYVYAHKGI